MTDTPDFPLAFAFEIALDWEDARHVCEHYGISQEKFQLLRKDETFRQAVQDALAYQQKEGVSFQKMAQVASHHAIKVVHRIAHNPEIPDSIRLSAAQTLARWAGYENKAPAEGQQQAQTPTIQMFFGAPPDEITDVTPSSPMLPVMEIQ